VSARDYRAVMATGRVVAVAVDDYGDVTVAGEEPPRFGPAVLHALNMLDAGMAELVPAGELTRMEAGAELAALRTIAAAARAYRAAETALPQCVEASTYARTAYATGSVRDAERAVHAINVADDALRAAERAIDAARSRLDAALAAAAGGGAQPEAAHPERGWCRWCDAYHGGPAAAGGGA
jgi:hypothetical protein